MINKVILNNRIHESADRLFADIQLMTEAELQDNLRYFAEKAKDIAESILEEYIFSTFEKYTSGTSAITDTEILSQFVNLNSGYQQRMLNWIQAHPLQVKEELLNFPKKESFHIETKALSPQIILGSGSLLAVGLFIFTNIWIALAAEILTIAFAKHQNDRIAKRCLIELEIEQKQYETAIKAKKDKLINGMIDELEKWLDLGEEASNDILASFNI